MRNDGTNQSTAGGALGQNRNCQIGRAAWREKGENTGGGGTRKKKNQKEIDNICEECKEKDESVLQNLILTGFKICKSCRISKTIFPI